MFQFTELVGLTKKPFHLVGTSLGGVIATVYAATFGSKVERATLICPGVSVQYGKNKINDHRFNEGFT